MTIGTSATMSLSIETQQRILSEIMASLPGACPGSTTTAPPTDKVRSSAESIASRKSSCPPALVAARRTDGASMSVTSPLTNRAGRAHVA